MKYPVGIQDFEKVRQGGYEYVDKTRYVHTLAANSTYYFLSRPRRFGKSLFLSTLKAYFQGKKELFEGLAIAEMEKEWKSYPVLYLDLNAQKYRKAEELEDILHYHLCKWEALYGCPSRASLPLRFANVIECAAKQAGSRVVILIDEYDKPLIQAMGNEALQEEYKALLKAFYANLKSMDAHIHFAFLTGVTKLSKVSVFSDLNNLNDISLSPVAWSICGITETELDRHFAPSVGELARFCGKDEAAVRQMLKRMYDGYHFCHTAKEGIYNPFSILNTFSNQMMSTYWYETGTPSFPVQILRQAHYDLRLLQNGVTSTLSGGVDTCLDDPVPVIYQSGYLTIKDYDPDYHTYTLGFPNEEVARGFVQDLLKSYAPKTSFAPNFLKDFVLDLTHGCADDFMRRLQAFFAGANYQIAGDAEKYFQNCLFLIFRMLGFHVHTEQPTGNGRTDILVETDRYVYIIETKLDGSPLQALRQIADKGYAQPYATDPRKLICIGINFSSATRGIADWLIK